MQVRLEGSHVHGRMLQPHHPPCPRPSCPGLGRMLSLWAEMTSPRGEGFEEQTEAPGLT